MATEEGVQAERLRGEERGLSDSLELKPKRVVFPIAGKGGVGKTTVMATSGGVVRQLLATKPTSSIWTPTIRRKGA